MTGFAVFYSDLKPGAREKLLDTFNLDCPEEADWHNHPLALINRSQNPEIPEPTEVTESEWR